MTEQEWAAFTLEIEATFRGGLEEDREAALREHFGRVDFDLARRVIARLVLDEQTFVPTPGELVGTLRRVTGGRRWEFECAILGMTSEQLIEHKARQRDGRMQERRQYLLEEGTRHG